MIDSAPLCAPTSICRRQKSRRGPGDQVSLARRTPSTKIHALVDLALGKPVGLFLTGGEAHDLE